MYNTEKSTKQAPPSHFTIWPAFAIKFYKEDIYNTYTSYGDEIRKRKHTWNKKKYGKKEHENNHEWLFTDLNF